jgi:hypothetical protein
MTFESSSPHLNPLPSMGEIDERVATRNGQTASPFRMDRVG